MKQWRSGKVSRRSELEGAGLSSEGTLPCSQIGDPVLAVQKQKVAVLEIVEMTFFKSVSSTLQLVLRLLWPGDVKLAYLGIWWAMLMVDNFQRIEETSLYPAIWI